MKALVIQELGHLAVEDRGLPSQRPDYIRVKTVAVAVNPSTFTSPLNPDLSANVGQADALRTHQTGRAGHVLGDYVLQYLQTSHMLTNRRL